MNKVLVPVRLKISFRKSYKQITKTTPVRVRLRLGYEKINKTAFLFLAF